MIVSLHAYNHDEQVALQTLFMSIIIRWFAEHVLGLAFSVMSLLLPVSDILTIVRFRLKSPGLHEINR